MEESMVVVTITDYTTMVATKPTPVKTITSDDLPSMVLFSTPTLELVSTVVTPTEFAPSTTAVVTTITASPSGTPDAVPSPGHDTFSSKSDTFAHVALAALVLVVLLYLLAAVWIISDLWHNGSKDKGTEDKVKHMEEGVAPQVQPASQPQEEEKKVVDEGTLVRLNALKCLDGEISPSSDHFSVEREDCARRAPKMVRPPKPIHTTRASYQTMSQKTPARYRNTGEMGAASTSQHDSAVDIKLPGDIFLRVEKEAEPGQETYTAKRVASDDPAVQARRKNVLSISTEPEATEAADTRRKKMRTGGYGGLPLPEEYREIDPSPIEVVKSNVGEGKKANWTKAKNVFGYGK